MAIGTPDEQAKFLHKLEEIGPEQVRKNLDLQLYGEESTWKVKFAKAFVKEALQKKDDELKQRQIDIAKEAVDVAKGSVVVAKEANDIARESNTTASRAFWISVIAAIAALLSAIFTWIYHT